ncbi:hypothetical protein T484DRAFT_1902036, partial [Baffinella frigidus]
EDASRHSGYVGDDRDRHDGRCLGCRGGQAGPLARERPRDRSRGRRSQLSEVTAL